jgi:L-fuculose-phosphate aldolase
MGVWESSPADEHRARQDVITVCRLMHEKNLIVATDGNVSVRLGPDRVLVTPSGAHKGLIKSEHLIVTDMQGRTLAGRGTPTSEMALHLAVYEVRPDVQAVIHAHPPVATAFSIAGVALDQCVIPEVVLTLGAIPTTEYATPSTPEGAAVIRRHITKCDALILARHGTVTVGENVLRAYYKLEKVEHSATVTLVARQLGQVQTLSPEEVQKLLEVRKQFGLSGQIYPCRTDGTCIVPDPSGEPEAKAPDEETLDRVADAVVQEIQRRPSE